MQKVHMLPKNQYAHLVLPVNKWKQKKKPSSNPFDFVVYTIFCAIIDVLKTFAIKATTFFVVLKIKFFFQLLYKSLSRLRNARAPSHSICVVAVNALVLSVWDSASCVLRVCLFAILRLVYHANGTAHIWFTAAAREVVFIVLSYGLSRFFLCTYMCDHIH